MTQSLSPTQVRRLLIIGAAVVGVVGIAVIGINLVGGEQTARPLGRVLSIAVVAPVEPDVQPGETMEVGALRDGFDRAALERAQAEAVDDTYLPPDAYVGDGWEAPPVPRAPKPTPVTDHPMADRPPSDPLADGSHLFGFDRIPTDRGRGGRERSEAPLPTAIPTASSDIGGQAHATVD